MADFLLLTEGGTAPVDEADKQKMIQEWDAWGASLGKALKDPGRPMQAAKTISADGSVSDSTGGPFNGYFMLTADSADAAVEMTRNCPVFRYGPTITLFQTFPMIAES